MKESLTIEQYCNMQTCSPIRIQKIKSVLKNSQKLAGKDLESLKIIDVMKFLRVINNSNFAQWTKNDYKKIFKSFLKWKYKKDFLKWTEDSNVKDSFKGTSKKKAFNKKKINKDTLVKPEELEKLLRAANSLKWKAFLTLMYESAFRPCELVNLRWEDCIPEESKGIWKIKTLSPKTKESRDIPVKDCIVHLKRWKEEYQFPNRTDKDFVFPNPQNRKEHLSEGGIGVIMKRICIKAGIRPLFPYMFRHSRIYFIQKRLGARIAAKYAGHSLETSEIYDHLDDDDVEEAMLDKIYTTKELTPEEENEVKNLKDKVDDLKKNLLIQTASNHLFFKYHTGKIQKPEFIEGIKKLNKAQEEMGIKEI